MDFFVNHFKASEAKYGNDPQLLSSIRTSWYAFDKYYSKSEEVPAYAATLLLHPFQRNAYIERV
ncbi:hypothetical protein GQ44DRAFT_692695 [Phaeosphaeriaceae sp. PMI808]|nr:hypothetical protein GQ44DRAFT_692695 [Phaeosphaeriaceae sp. PMI808]